MNRTFKNEIINDNLIDNLLTNNEIKEKEIRMNNFIRLMREIIIENEDIINADQKKAS
jgi:hypothetical protein